MLVEALQKLVVLLGRQQKCVRTELPKPYRFEVARIQSGKQVFHLIPAQVSCTNRLGATRLCFLHLVRLI